MIFFGDGPAIGTVLELRRGPVFLRAVLKDGKWDALDQLTDTPEPDEQVFVYFLAGRGGSVHIDYVDKRGRRKGAWFATGNYLLYHPQPDDDIVRDTAKWREWATAALERLRNPAAGDPPPPASA